MYKMILFDRNVVERFKTVFNLTDISKGLGISRTLLKYKLQKESNFSDEVQTNWVNFLKSESEILASKLRIINGEINTIEKYLSKK